MKKSFTEADIRRELQKLKQEIWNAIPHAEKLKNSPDSITRMLGELSEKTIKRIVAALNVIIANHRVDIKLELEQQIRLLEQNPIYDSTTEPPFSVFKTSTPTVFFFFDEAIKKLRHFLPDKDGMVCAHNNIIKDNCEGAECKDCGKSFGWFCPESPDKECHYYTDSYDEGLGVMLRNGEIILAKDLPSTWEENHESDDWCIFCGLPEERK